MWLSNQQTISCPIEDVSIETESMFTRVTHLGNITTRTPEYLVYGGYFHVLRSKKNLDKLGLVDDAGTYSLNFLKREYGTNLEIKCGYKLYPFQRKTMSFILKYFKSKKPIKRLLIDLAPGSGKGLLANYTVAKLGLRPMIIVKPTYVDKWIEELCFHYGITVSNIFIVNRVKQINNLEDLPFDPNIHKVIITTTTLVSSIIKDDGLKAKAHRLMDRVQSTLMINDESHQHFGSMSNAILLYNPTYLIGMSASLVSNDKVIERLQLDLYPNEQRLSFKANTPHIIYNIQKYRTNRLPDHFYQTHMGYNHKLYESNILKCPNAKLKYGLIIAQMVKYAYIDKRNTGDRLLILCDTIEMVEHLVTLLSSKLKQAKLDIPISKYTGTENYDYITKNDILVATVGKAGTAIDIPKLLVCINTVNLGSYQLNMQIPGRLRVREGIDLHFYLLVNQTIPKQSGYVFTYLRKFGYMYKSIHWRDSNLGFFVERIPRPKFNYRRI